LAVAYFVRGSFFEDSVGKAAARLVLGLQSLDTFVGLNAVCFTQGLLKGWPPGS
jgi:hypothetical protein